MNFPLVARHPLDMPTSAVGAMRQLIDGWLIRIGGALWVPGTSSAEGDTERDRALAVQTQTNSGVRVLETPATGTALMELRRLSGLTWEQLARLFGSTSRSLHFWASGKPMTPAHEERLHRLLATLRRLDRGSAQENRALLLGACEGDLIPFDLLMAGEYARVLALLGPGHATANVQSAGRGADTRQARAPYSPADLAGTLHDRVHTSGGQARVPRVTRGQA